jgi:hypothetical protein
MKNNGTLKVIGIGRGGQNDSVQEMTSFFVTQSRRFICPVM